MCEVTLENFNNLYPEIERDLKKSQFIAIDLEFSSLNPIDKTANSLFNTVEEMYAKIQKNVEHTIPLQVGVTAFEFNPQDHTYIGRVYTFYLFPRSFHLFDKYFVCQSSSLQFLSTYNFDFNKCIYKGIPFLNCTQEKSIRQSLKSSSELNNHFVEDIYKHHFPQISEWFNKSKEGDTFIIPDVISKHEFNFELIYLLHKNIRQNFSNKVWSFVDNKEFILKKVTPKEFMVLSYEKKLDEELMNNLLGFTRVFRLISELRRPIIGHNVLLDLIIMMNNFDDPMPKSYKMFKKNILKLFPTVFDTKTINFELRKTLPEDKQWEMGSLSNLFGYFKDGPGRHVAMQSPLIEAKLMTKHDEFHNAGWDSYCTGYIFIRMAHILISQKYESAIKKKFMSSELFIAVSAYKNCLNIIKGTISYIQLDGDDPISRRPPRLIIESIKNKPINVNQAASILSTYGFVEVKPFSLRGRRAIVAVDNFSSARRILQQFGRSDSDFRIVQYNALRHSPVARAFLWGGVIVSGALLVWIAKTSLKR